MVEETIEVNTATKGGQWKPIMSTKIRCSFVVPVVHLSTKHIYFRVEKVNNKMSLLQFSAFIIFAPQ